MSAVRIQIQIDDESLKGPLLWSFIFHALLLGALAISTLLSHTGETWGGTSGGAISVKLIGSLGGVPLPRPSVVTTSRVVDTSKGLYKSEPKPKIEKLPTEAKKIPEFAKEKPPHYVTRPSKVLENKTPPPPNAVPYGQGGAPAVPYQQFNLGASGKTSGGMGFTGPSGGNFGARFPWYVDAVRNRVSSNWLQTTVDPSVQWAPRAVVTFDILRDGTVANVQILRSSGNASVDNSAVRAILSSNPLNPLPNEYAGSKVSVEFWFDFHR
jgi:periplasmic protein TonB